MNCRPLKKVKSDECTILVGKMYAMRLQDANRGDDTRDLTSK